LFYWEGVATPEWERAGGWFNCYGIKIDPCFI